MNKKSLIAIILLLSFVIAILLFNQKDVKDEAVDELEEELIQMEEENERLDEKVKSTEEIEEENARLEEKLGQIESENEDLMNTLSESSFSLVIVTDAEIEQRALKLHITPVTIEEDKLVQTEPEMTTYVEKDVPIYMLNEWGTLYEEDWNYMIDLDRTPVLELFHQGFGYPLFIRETARDHDLEFEGW